MILVWKVIFVAIVSLPILFECRDRKAHPKDCSDFAISFSKSLAIEYYVGVTFGDWQLFKNFMSSSLGADFDPEVRKELVHIRSIADGQKRNIYDVTIEQGGRCYITWKSDLLLPSPVDLCDHLENSAYANTKNTYSLMENLCRDEDFVIILRGLDDHG